MKTTNNTVLVTGGSAGIGLAIAQNLSEAGNQVIILGRNKERLDKAVASLKNVTGIVCDVADETSVNQLVDTLHKDFPKLNIVINNAGAAGVGELGAGVSVVTTAAEEIKVNYLSVVALNEKLLPLLKQQEEAAIVNVTSIVAFAPNRFIPTYSASKAALHSYSQILRYTLQKASSNVKVFELMPPLVNTEFSKEIGGENGIPPQQVATDLFNAFKNDEFEIHVGATADIYKAFLISPQTALEALNSRGE